MKLFISKSERTPGPNPFYVERAKQKAYEIGILSKNKQPTLADMPLVSILKGEKDVFLGIHEESVVGFILTLDAIRVLLWHFHTLNKESLERINNSFSIPIYFDVFLKNKDSEEDPFLDILSCEKSKPSSLVHPNINIAYNAEKIFFNIIDYKIVGFTLNHEDLLLLVNEMEPSDL
jgi:hypothetical protein